MKNKNVVEMKNKKVCQISFCNIPLDILQIILNDDGTCKHVILKTFWIKIIQRKWKKTMLQKKEHDKKIKKQIHSFSNTHQITCRTNNSYKGLNGLIM